MYPPMNSITLMRHGYEHSFIAGNFSMLIIIRRGVSVFIDKWSRNSQFEFASMRLHMYIFVHPFLGPLADLWNHHWNRTEEWKKNMELCRHTGCVSRESNLFTAILYGIALPPHVFRWIWQGKRAINLVPCSVATGVPFT